MSENLLHKRDKVQLFQLYLLSFMRVSPTALSRGLNQLNSNAVELEAVKNSMKGLAFEQIGGPTVEFYREMLGEPATAELVPNEKLPEVFHGARALRFKLPLWPEFDFVINAMPDGKTFDPSFRRSLTAGVPPLNGIGDLEPWKFVKEEVDARFGLSKYVDAWDTWEEVQYTIPDSRDGQATNYFVLYDFNLLQIVRQNG